MSSRENILKSINSNKPALVPLPSLQFEITSNHQQSVQEFIEVAVKIGATISRAETIGDINKALQFAILNERYIVNTISEIGEINPEINAANDAVFLEKIDKAYVMGSLGVAENGCIWVTEKSMINRLLPFICQHLVLIIRIENIVATMHQAYDAIKIDEEGYGVFIAGPSKTADIEQSLVIGAHGARSVEIILLGGQ